MVVTWSNILLIILSAAILIIFHRHFSAMRVIKYYAQQGITVFPGAYTFFFGNIKLVSQWEELRLQSH